MAKLPLLEARTSFSGKIDTDLVAVFQDSSKRAIVSKPYYEEWVERLRKSKVFSAKLGTTQMIRFGGKEPAENVLLVGLGQEDTLTEEKLRIVGGHTWVKLSSEKIKTILVHVESFLNSGSRQENTELSSNPARYLRAFAEGLILNSVPISKIGSKKSSEARKQENDTREEFSDENSEPVRIIFLTQDDDLKAELEIELAQVRAIGTAVQVTRDWSNLPSNLGTPIYFAQEAKELARKYGLKFKVLSEKDAAAEKMGLFLGVGQGSSRESQIVIVEYHPSKQAMKQAKKAEKRKPKKSVQKYSGKYSSKTSEENEGKSSRDGKTLAFVGKGVTFDSGGISIKPSARMEDMKHDMTGAATVMGALILAASWEVQNHVIGIMAFVENMPDGDAIQPGNVLTSRNGKTVEIINTDAEGRLVLADVLDYAQDFKPDAVIDIATLTGAVSIALGKQCCAVLGNQEELIHDVQQAGESQGERIWQLPLFDDYFDDLKSDYADMKNAANDSNGGTIRGAIFLKQFIRKGIAWAHLDIAAMAYNVSHLSYFPKKGASGAYVRALAQLAADFKG